MVQCDSRVRHTTHHGVFSLRIKNPCEKKQCPIRGRINLVCILLGISYVLSGPMLDLTLLRIAFSLPHPLIVPGTL